VQAKIRQGLLLVNNTTVEDGDVHVTDRYDRSPMVQWKGDAAIYNNIHKAMKEPG
jgi:hypothetical protein